MMYIKDPDARERDPHQHTILYKPELCAPSEKEKKGKKGKKKGRHQLYRNHCASTDSTVMMPMALGTTTAARSASDVVE